MKTRTAMLTATLTVSMISSSALARRIDHIIVEPEVQSSTRTTVRDLSPRVQVDEAFVTESDTDGNRRIIEGWDGDEKISRLTTADEDAQLDARAHTADVKIFRRAKDGKLALFEETGHLGDIDGPLYGEGTIHALALGASGAITASAGVDGVESKVEAELYGHLAGAEAKGKAMAGTQNLGAGCDAVCDAYLGASAKGTVRAAGSRKDVGIEAGGEAFVGAAASVMVDCFVSVCGLQGGGGVTAEGSAGLGVAGKVYAKVDWKKLRLRIGGWGKTTAGLGAGVRNEIAIDLSKLTSKRRREVADCFARPLNRVAGWIQDRATHASETVDAWTHTVQVIGGADQARRLLDALTNPHPNVCGI